MPSAKTNNLKQYISALLFFVLAIIPFVSRAQVVGPSSDSAAAPGFTWFGDTTTGIWRPAASTVSITTGAGERLRVNSAGQVGVGTTNPSRPLTVNGIIKSLTGGFEFPDGTTMSTAATASSDTLATVTGRGASTNTASTFNGGLATSTLTSTGEIIGTMASGYGQLRLTNGNYGTIFRNDGVNTYILLTSSGDPNGSWNSLRPITYNNATGSVTLNSDGASTATGGSLNIGANLSFTPANPSLTTGGSYLTIPNGLYVSGGTLYAQTQAQFRGGIHNDGAAYLRVDGGTSGYTYFPGSVGIGVSGPAQLLQVKGTARFGSDANGYVELLSTASEGGTMNLRGANGTNMFLENINGTFRLVNSGWTLGIFQIDQTGNVSANGTVNGSQLCIASDCRASWAAATSEADTLATVTARGATSATGLTVNQGWAPAQAISITSNNVYKSQTAGDATLYLNYGVNGGAVAVGGAAAQSNNLNVYGTIWARDGISLNGNAVWHAGNLTNLNQLTNGPGYITGVTSGMITTALGYTPVNLAGDTMTGRLNQSTNGFGGITKDNITTRTDSGFYQTSAASTANGWPTNSGGWYQLISSTHTNLGNYYSMQFAGDYSNQNELYYRATNSSGTTAWSKVWTSGNLTNLNQLTNGPGYITSVTGSLGYTPVNKAGDSSVGILDFTSGNYIRFGHANQSDGNDGKIGAGLFAEGLNIVGTQTVAAAGRKITTWGNITSNGSFTSTSNISASGTANAAQLCIAGDCRASWAAATTEADTLATVTGRGATTATATTFTGALNANGNVFSNNASPTIYLTDNDQRSAMIHVNSNQFFILTGSGVNSTSWAVNGSNWPLQIDLTTDAITLGGDTNVAEGTLSVGGNSVWHAGNFSPSNYISKSGDTVSNVIFFQSNKGATSTLGANTSYALEAFSTDGGAAAMSFHRSGAYAVNFGLDPDNVLRIGGWSASANRWQLDMAGNETLAGGLTASSVTASGAITSSEWFRTTGAQGWYNNTYGGGIYMADTTWIRTYNNASFWTAGGQIGGDGGLTIGYGGATAPGGGAIISGKVGIGVNNPSAKLQIAGQSISVSPSGGAQSNGSAAVDWNNGNAQTMTVACTSTTFSNMLDGGTYILAVSETGTTTCTFSQAGLTFYYSPANSARTSGQRTVYTFQRIGSDVYVSWIKGFQ